MSTKLSNTDFLLAIGIFTPFAMFLFKKLFGMFLFLKYNTEYKNFKKLALTFACFNCNSARSTKFLRKYAILLVLNSVSSDKEKKYILLVLIS